MVLIGTVAAGCFVGPAKAGHRRTREAPAPVVVETPPPVNLPVAPVVVLPPPPAPYPYYGLGPFGPNPVGLYGY